MESDESSYRKQRKAVVTSLQTQEQPKKFQQGNGMLKGQVVQLKQQIVVAKEQRENFLLESKLIFLYLSWNAKSSKCGLTVRVLDPCQTFCLVIHRHFKKTL